MTCQQNLVMADFTSKSAIFCAPTPELGATVSTLPGRIAGQMAELLMNSAIVRLKIPIISMCNSADRVNTNLVRAIALQMFLQGFQRRPERRKPLGEGNKDDVERFGRWNPTNVGIMAVQ